MPQTYNVEITHQGKTHRLEVPENRKILEFAEDKGLELPNSCNSGVCTTCAALLETGTVDQSEGMGLSPDLQKEGYALLCVSYPRSDLTAVTEKEDEVYERQFGRPKK